MADEIVVADTQYALGIIKVGTPHDIIVEASRIATELKSIVAINKLSRKIQGREYVFVEGWSTMGAMLGVLPREVPEMFRWDDDGSCEATIELFRITDGMVVGRASARVGADELDSNGKQTWGSRPMYARKSMAQTRATGKAFRLGFSWIMTLAGYAPTPYEEMAPMMVINGKAKDKEPSKTKVKDGMNSKPFGDMTAEELLFAFSKSMNARISSGFTFTPESFPISRDQVALEIGHILNAEYGVDGVKAYNFLTGSACEPGDNWHEKATDVELVTFYKFLNVQIGEAGPYADNERLIALDTVWRHVQTDWGPKEETPF